MMIFMRQVAFHCAILLLMIFGFAGCAAGTTTPQLRGEVSIEAPLTGSVIYAETIFIRGTADNLPDYTFWLEVNTATDESLFNAPITVVDGQWSVEIVPEYAGDPVEVTIFALPANREITQEYDVESVVLSRPDLRPDGQFGSIRAPQPGSNPGGDRIEVSGTASGLFENNLIVSLERADGTVIDEQVVTLANPYFVDEVVWFTSVATNDAVGPAIIRAYGLDARDGSEIVLDRLEISLGDNAG